MRFLSLFCRLTFTFGRELNRRRRNQNVAREGERDEKKEERQEGGESLMIDHAPFRKLPGNGKARPRYSFSHSVRSIEGELDRTIFDSKKRIEQKLSSQMASIKRAGLRRFILFFYRV